ncbi:MAG: hypothetical protein Q9214_001206 [Letrouitia sp. 1 TL-2023]
MHVDTLSVRLLQAAANYSYGSSLGSIQPEDSVQVISYDARFSDSMGSNISASIVGQHNWDFVHEAGVYLPSTRSIYAASQTVAADKPINITVLDGSTYSLISSFALPQLHMPNGATAYNDTHILFCVFGHTDAPSTLSLWNPSTNESSVLLSSFYGRRFTSINDVRVKRDDGTIWFTDDWYGYYEGFKSPPTMPAQVYRFDPVSGNVRAVADGFDQPNGLEFSPDYKILYVADSGYVHGPGNFNMTRPNGIYAFDVMESGGLSNRRLHAFGARPFVDGMHVDAQGNVWSTSGEGVTAWDESGVVLGEVRVDTDVNNFLFVPDGILLLAFTKLWHVKCGMRPRKGESW